MSRGIDAVSPRTEDFIMKNTIITSLAALALAGSLGTVGVARAADRAPSPYAPTVQVAGTSPASPLHSRTAGTAAVTSQAPDTDRTSGATRYQWGCPVGSTRGCW